MSRKRRRLDDVKLGTKKGWFIESLEEAAKEVETWPDEDLNPDTLSIRHKLKPVLHRRAQLLVEALSNHRVADGGNARKIIRQFHLSKWLKTGTPVRLDCLLRFSSHGGPVVIVGGEELIFKSCEFARAVRDVYEVQHHDSELQILQVLE